MSLQKRLLIIDDDIDLCNLLKRFFGREGFKVDVLYSSDLLVETIQNGKYDLILCDYRLRNQEGEKTLAVIKEQKPFIPVIIMTAYGDIKCAVSMIKKGAYDYITKPLLREELLVKIKEAIDSSKEEVVSVMQTDPGESAADRAKTLKEDVCFYTGVSPEMRFLDKRIEIVSPTNFSVIISGESGSGKEVVARSIHQKSLRKDGPFVAVDCGVLTRELANSELFGHRKGSFTGAFQDKKGCFELADHGTLFLDEIANLSYEIQGALLRAIQERKIKRIGDPQKEIDVDVRIMVASHEDLAQKCKDGLFRHDLFHRLNEFKLEIPPLRERIQDIPGMTDFILKRVSKDLKKKILGVNKAVMKVFEQYPWPGNVRELWNVVRRAALVEESGQLTLDSLDKEFLDMAAAGEKEVHDYPRDIVSSGLALPDLKKVRLKAEYKTIMKVLKAVDFNKSKAAEILEVDRKTLYNKIKDYEDEIFNN